MLRLLIIVATALIAGYCLGRTVLFWFARRRIARRIWKKMPKNSKAPSFLWRMRNGVAVSMPFARVLLKRPVIRRFIDEALDLVAQRGVTTTSQALCSTLIWALAVLFVAGTAAARTPICGLALDGCLLVGLAGYIGNARDRHTATLRDGIPDALRSLGTSIKTGLTLQQTMQRASEEIDGPLGKTFETAALRLQTGCGTADSLTVFRGDGIRELAFVAVALDVQHISGGSIAGVLDSARESVQSEINLGRSLKVQTAQARLSARIVTIMPFVLVALFSLISEDFLAPFFESLAGMGLLAMAVAMQIAGVLAVRSLLDVEGM